MIVSELLAENDDSISNAFTCEEVNCIDSTCYTLPYYSLQSPWNASFDIEFLYWYARESNLAYALKVEGIPITVVQPAVPIPSTAIMPKARKTLSTQWDPGFRIGIGSNSDCDGWNLYTSWTYLVNKKSNSASVGNFGTPSLVRIPNYGQFALLNPWISTNANPLLDLANIWRKVSANWKLHINVIDLELGRKYWLSKCFAMHPFAAIRGAWTKTTFRTISSIVFTSGNNTEDVVLTDTFKNRYWGVGFLAGFQPSWYIHSCFAIYSNIDVALLWGEFSAKKREKGISIQTGLVPATSLSYINKEHSDFFMMEPIIDLAIGLRWDLLWCCNRYRTIIDIGWEHHIWFDHNHRLKTKTFQEEADANYKWFQNFEETYGNLMFGGLVTRLRWDF